MLISVKRDKYKLVDKSFRSYGGGVNSDDRGGQPPDD